MGSYPQNSMHNSNNKITLFNSLNAQSAKKWKSHCNFYSYFFYWFMKNFSKLYCINSDHNRACLLIDPSMLTTPWNISVLCKKTLNWMPRKTVTSLYELNESSINFANKQYANNGMIKLLANICVTKVGLKYLRRTRKISLRKWWTGRVFVAIKNDFIFWQCVAFLSMTIGWIRPIRI